MVTAMDLTGGRLVGVLFAQLHTKRKPVSVRTIKVVCAIVALQLQQRLASSV